MKVRAGDMSRKKANVAFALGIAALDVGGALILRALGQTKYSKEIEIFSCVGLAPKVI